jgi:hypothetical protein
LPACSRNKAPDFLFDAAGYHARGDKVYCLSAFPGKASEIAGADATSFKAFDTTYAKDKSNAYFDGNPIPAADATTFAVLDRGGFARTGITSTNSTGQRRPGALRAARRRPVEKQHRRVLDRRRCVVRRPCAFRDRLE